MGHGSQLGPFSQPKGSVFLDEFYHEQPSMTLQAYNNGANNINNSNNSNNEDGRGGFECVGKSLLNNNTTQ